MFLFTEHPPRGVIVSDIQSHSVQISWEAVEGAENYNISLTKTMRDDQLGLCSESHTVSVGTSNLSIVVGQTAEDMLRAYTTYSITVVAMSDVWGSSGESEPINTTTHQTCKVLCFTKINLIFFPPPLSLSPGATVPPSNVTTRVVSSTIISVQWDGLTPCTQVNGLIVNYSVQYKADSSGVIDTLVYAGKWNVKGAGALLTELVPFTNYTIRIAAVNEQGDVGPYSDSKTEQTEEDSE